MNREELMDKIDAIIKKALEDIEKYGKTDSDEDIQEWGNIVHFSDIAVKKLASNYFHGAINDSPLVE